MPSPSRPGHPLWPRLLERPVTSPPSLPWVTDTDRRRGRRLYRGAWVRNMSSRPRPLPDGARTITVATVDGTVDAHVLDGDDGRGTVVLVHPHRRYGGHWFVKTGWVDALHTRGKTVVWFDQPGYGQGTGGSPYLGENVLAVADMARHLDAGPLDVAGQSLGAFVSAIAAPHMPHVRRIVMESPYRSFTAWYDDQPLSLGKVATHLFARLFPHADRLDTQKAIAAAPQEMFVGASEDDSVTSIRQSLAAVEGHDVTLHTVRGKDHLELWDDPEYRAAVLAFLD